MRRLRLLLLPIALLGAVTVAGCGVEAGDRAAGSGEITTTTARSDTTTTAPLTAEQQRIVDRMAETYRKLGLDDEQARCLAGAMGGLLGDSGATPDQGSLMDAVNQCDIPMSKLAEIGRGTDGTLEGGFKRGFVLSLEQSGLTEKQATCVADGYIKAYGTDVSAATDTSKMSPLFEACGATPGG